MGERAAQVKGSHGTLPQHLHLLRGAPHLVLEATPAQASPQLLLLPGLVGGQLLGPQTHKHTCTKHSHCCPRARSEPPGGAAGFVSGTMAQTASPQHPVPLRKVRGQRGLRSSNKEPAARSPAACLGGAHWSQNLPLPGPGENRLPWGAIFTVVPSSPFLLCLSAQGGEGPSTYLPFSQPSVLLRAVYSGAC